MHTCTHACAHTRTHTRTHTYICKHARTHALTHARTHTHTHTHIHRVESVATRVMEEMLREEVLLQNFAIVLQVLLRLRQVRKL